MEEDGGNLKIDRIIEAAKKEFGEKGYEKASTARICEKAGVSKGLLFHHFGTKKGLYLELYERIIADFTVEIKKLTYDDCKTYLDTIIKGSKRKLKYFAEHPGVYEIVMETSYFPPDEVKDDIKSIFDKYINMEDYFSEHVFEKYEFRKEINPKKAWEVISAVVSLVERKIMNGFKENKKSGKPFLDEIVNMSDELFEYFDIIFNGILISGASKRGLVCERDYDSEERHKAV